MRERLAGYLAEQLCLLLQMGEELVQFGLDALAHAGEHQCNQCRQGQFATTLERRGMLGIAGKLTKLLSLNMGGEVGKQSGKRHGANEDQKDPHWPQPCWRLKRRQQGCGRAKLASCQVLF
ncbi:hypothetical protein BSU04_29915 [Caballeronia sordidicola]|uniref:Uncharacterized protein n=1 Tax=Caballeronia sordidicola TaxID=196367 RepID=A0A226WVK7_CABSO|nr:hypothetical protein BSU04_29915 [Caballeronia sordidicola]